jgi:hypothetical protein
MSRDDGQARFDDHVGAVIRQYSGIDGALVAQLIAESQYDPATLEEFHRRFWDARRDSVRALIERGKTEGEISTDADAAPVATIIYAPIYQRLLFKDGPLDAAFARDLVALALSGVSA